MPIYEELYPGTKARNVEGHVSNYKTSSEINSFEVSKPSFVSDTSAKTGESDSNHHFEDLISRNIIPDVLGPMHGVEYFALAATREGGR